LENLELSEDEEIYTKLDQLLIRMNFNSRLYVKHLKQKIMSLIKMSIATQEEKEEWLFYKKHFHQFYQRTDTVFVANDADLKLQLDNWFLRKIFYIEKEIPSSISSDIGKTLPSKEKSQKQQKLRTKLSVDQMALILRAADDQRIVIAKSLSSIFKNIAPYLSTPYREDISFESMRSKSYYPETRDKEIAIQTLREIIDKIREY
jgi:hypothetical protein